MKFITGRQLTNGRALYMVTLEMYHRDSDVSVQKDKSSQCSPKLRLYSNVFSCQQKVVSEGQGCGVRVGVWLRAHSTPGLYTKLSATQFWPVYTFSSRATTLCHFVAVCIFGAVILRYAISICHTVHPRVGVKVWFWTQSLSRSQGFSGPKSQSESEIF